MCDNQQYLVVVTHIWPKFSSVERKVTLIVTHFWQLFSGIFGETEPIFSISIHFFRPGP
jgi:hypothetical protein